MVDGKELECVNGVIRRIGMITKELGESMEEIFESSNCEEIK